jgi:hypothetical protein
MAADSYTSYMWNNTNPFGDAYNMSFLFAKLKCEINPQIKVQN